MVKRKHKGLSKKARRDQEAFARLVERKRQEYVAEHFRRMRMRRVLRLAFGLLAAIAALTALAVWLPK